MAIIIMLVFRSKATPVLLTVYLLLISGGNLFGAILTVTTKADTNDAVCDSQCSLREAIETASVGDTIIFARELRGSTIELLKPLLIRKRLTIDGPNNRRITIKGNNTFRIFHLLVGNTGGRVVTLDGLIIRDGYEANGDGGGIYVDPAFTTTLNVTNCAVLNNTAQHGGGIYMYNSGTLYLIDSTVANNTATADNSGGGVDVSRSLVRIMNSTISGNQVTSTVDGAGGIRLYQNDNWFINGSTIADNSSSGTSSFSAGGLAALGGRSPGPIWNTILAGNTGLNSDYYGVSSGARNSLIGITDFRSGFLDGVSGNIVGSVKTPVDPQLGLLADNGGGLPTRALLPASPAIDKGTNALSTDQQGQPLIIDQRRYQRIVNSTVDMGSYEFGSQPAATTSTITGQVTMANGRGVPGARIIMKDESGEVKMAVTNPFGYYRFMNVATGSVYSFDCLDKRNIFLHQNILIEESDENINFRAK